MLSSTKLTPTITRQQSLRQFFKVFTIHNRNIYLIKDSSSFFNIMFQHFRKRHLEFIFPTLNSPPSQKKFKHCFGLSIHAPANPVPFNG